MSRRKDLQVHLFRLVHLARSAHLKRALSKLDPDPALNFWRVILGNHLDISFLEWCKIFGSDTEATHWKHIVPAAEHERFRQDLLAAIGLTADEWAAYWSTMTDYRNKQVAHYEELPLGSNYPALDHALSSSYYYYQYLIAELRVLGETKYPNDLEVYSGNFAKQARQIAECALKATADVEESVW